MEVVHVSLPNLGKTWNPWMSGKNEHIEKYVRSLLDLTRKFPDLDLTEAMWPLHYFRIDPKTEKWRKAFPGEEISLPRAIAIAETWASIKPPNTPFRRG